MDSCIPGPTKCDFPPRETQGDVQVFNLLSTPRLAPRFRLSHDTLVVDRVARCPRCFWTEQVLWMGMGGVKQETKSTPLLFHGG